MSSQQIQQALWISQPILQSTIGMVAFRRRLHKQFPAFFAYTLAQVAFFVVTFPFQGHYQFYFTAYYIAAGLNVMFAFKIIHEVFLDIFRPYPALRDLGSALFKWAAMIMILVSVVMISMSPGWDDPVGRTILVVQRCVDVIQCGMVIFLLAFCQNLRVSWQRQSFGIALGFGVTSGIELLTHALYSGSHMHWLTTNLFNLLGYELSLALWLTYAFINAGASTASVLVPQRWDDALMELHPQEDTQSLIPMFEHMVDRALSKTQNQHV